MKFLIKLLFLGVIIFGAYYLFAPQEKKITTSVNKNSATNLKPNPADEGLANNLSINNNMAKSFYNGVALPSITSYLLPPNVDTKNRGGLILNNSNSGTDVVIDLRLANTTTSIVMAFVKKGDQFMMANIPSAEVNVLITDARNSQVTTTRAIKTDDVYRITPYQESSGEGSVLLYRAESTKKND